MKWKQGWPTPEFGRFYLLANFIEADTIMRCELEFVCQACVQEITQEEYEKKQYQTHPDRTDFFYSEENYGLQRYFWLYTFDKIMIDPNGIPYFSHYTELEYPKEDF